MITVIQVQRLYLFIDCLWLGDLGNISKSLQGIHYVYLLLHITHCNFSNWLDKYHCTVCVIIHKDEAWNRKNIPLKHLFWVKYCGRNNIVWCFFAHSGMQILVPYITSCYLHTLWKCFLFSVFISSWFMLLAICCILYHTVCSTPHVHNHAHS